MKSKNYCIIRDKSLLTLVDFTTPILSKCGKKERKTLILAIFSLSLQQQNIENENGKCKEVFVGNDTWRTKRGC